MIGVIIVTYASSDVIVDCLASLLPSHKAELRVVVADNQSPDDTVSHIRAWAHDAGIELEEYEACNPPAESEKLTPAPITVVHTGGNLGYAGGVNAGLRILRTQPDIDLFWVLNPDCVVPSETPSAIQRAASAHPGFGIMGGRIIYQEPPNLIQSDGGRLRRWTGICENINQGYLPDQAVPPDPGSLSFVSGAHLIVSRTFLDQVGLMREDYFLYFEEVDWAMRRGNLSLNFCSDALVYHHGGTSIGTGSVTRRASGFANYFNYRNRMRFMRRFYPGAVPAAYFYSFLKIIKLASEGAWMECIAAFRGLNGMSPPHAVAERVTSNAHIYAFGPIDGAHRETYH